jgi:Rrf2 family protein
MRISAKVDYAMRAMTELAVAPVGRPLKAERIAEAQGIPQRFLNNILQDLRRAGLVERHRGPEGGHLLARGAEKITVADVIRAADGPLGAVAGVPPESTEYHGAATRMRETWVAARASVREVLEHVTVADIAHDSLPPAVTGMIESPDAWVRR